jgi:hypothetical protein
MVSPSAAAAIAAQGVAYCFPGPTRRVFALAVRRSDEKLDTVMSPSEILTLRFTEKCPGTVTARVLLHRVLFSLIVQTASPGKWCGRPMRFIFLNFHWKPACEGLVKAECPHFCTTDVF